MDIFLQCTQLVCPLQRQEALGGLKLWNQERGGKEGEILIIEECRFYLLICSYYFFFPWPNLKAAKPAHPHTHWNLHWSNPQAARSWNISKFNEWEVLSAQQYRSLETCLFDRANPKCVRVVIFPSMSNANVEAQSDAAAWRVYYFVNHFDTTVLKQSESTSGNRIKENPFSDRQFQFEA